MKRTVWQGTSGPVEVELRIVRGALHAVLAGTTRVACQTDDGDLVWCCPDDLMSPWPDPESLMRSAPEAPRPVHNRAQPRLRQWISRWRNLTAQR